MGQTGTQTMQTPFQSMPYTITLPLYDSTFLYSLSNKTFALNGVKLLQKKHLSYLGIYVLNVA